MKESPCIAALFPSFSQTHSSVLCPYNRIAFRCITERKYISYIPKYELTEKPLKSDKSLGKTVHSTTTFTAVMYGEFTAMNLLWPLLRT